MRLDAAADFADLFEVKDALEKKGELYTRVEADAARPRLPARDLRARDAGSRRREPPSSATRACTSRSTSSRTERGRPASTSCRAPDTTWRVDSTSTVSRAATPNMPREPRRSGSPPRRSSSRLATSSATSTSAASSTWRRCASIPTSRLPAGASVPAAGLPWFMALFGRDSLITSFQALPFAPELAADHAARPAARQGDAVDDFRDEEPGKILHELRFGELTAFEERPALAVLRRGRLDAAVPDRCSTSTSAGPATSTLVRELEPDARAALDWIDEYGDRDGDGYVEYERRNTETGLENQCWKDSWNSIVFADGTLARRRRATCEIQGYVYDAKRRCARLAREVWDDAALAERLEREAAELEAPLQPGLLDRRARVLRARARRRRSARSTRSPRTSATCSGAASSTTTRPTPSSGT